MQISEYGTSNTEEIVQLFVDVFSDSEGEEEGLSIGRLVSHLLADTDADDIFGYVATDNGQLMGCILFTRLTFETGVNAFILSPVAIRSDSQRQGVGQKLITFGIERLREKGVAMLFTYGDPNYYSRVGFMPVAEETVQAPVHMTQPEGWLGQSLVGDEIAPIPGNSHCVSALNKPEYW